MRVNPTIATILGMFLWWFPITGKLSIRRGSAKKIGECYDTAANITYEPSRKGPGFRKSGQR
jgi:hypothetical protein